MNGSVHIVIVNWNTGGYLKRCLESIAEMERADREAVRVTVIDNASSDESATDLDDLGLPFEVMHNRVNIGFAAACNQGAAGSDGDYLLFLNPDTELAPGALATAVDFMQSEGASEVGICGAQILDPRGRPTISCARFPTLRVLFGKMTALSRILPQVFPSHHLGPEETRESRVVDQVIGAFFLVRRQLFASLGGFDTRYFIYYEEVDFSARAFERGFLSYFLREATVVHAGNVSTEQAKDLRLYHSLRSRLIYARRHWPSWQAVVLGVLTLTFELPARMLLAVLRGSGADLSAAASAYGRLAGDAGRALAARSAMT